jgi:hypothetical protein
MKLFDLMIKNLFVTCNLIQYICKSKGVKDPVLMQSAKKKNNKGWNELPTGYSESNTPHNSQNSRGVEDNTNLNALNEPSSQRYKKME